ncbi:MULTISPECIES: threonine synthase [unclassified Mesotoga]|jgi:threonine synthase|uniref:threonine synthase n=1 Tax=unclassified Mesotoga TaxID=1184398 RepID=UPI000A82F725|nr:MULTISPECIES: threonine synthase [unclassified Mesotoga]HAY98252.1 threonine synthase [Mesotoga sp.]
MKGLIASYERFLPVTQSTPRITLLEGNTPLIYLENISRKFGPKVYVKYEGANPTGSFKDRGMVLAIAKAIEEGSKAVICASTGNTSASAAAYSARTGLKSIILIPEGKIALGKLAQAMIYGAKVIQIDGNFDDCLELAKKISEEYPVTLVNSLNPYRLEGQKTAAFEIIDVLGRAPDYHFIPVGNAGNIAAYWMGYREYHERGLSGSLPKMMGFQAEGAAPIVYDRVFEHPETIATAIRIGNPASWKKAVAARDESGGVIEALTDEEILNAQKLLASTEGVFCEPASAASFGGFLRKAYQGLIQPSDVVVCTLTGNGLKDPDAVIKSVDMPVVIHNSLEAVVHEAGLK